MNALAAVLVFVGVLWTQTSALDSYALTDPSNNYVTGTMTIDNGDQVVEVHVHNGLSSSDTIFDYSHGYVATRLLSRKACFILKIEKDVIPELQEIGRLAFEKKTLKRIYSPKNVWVQYQAGNSWFGNFRNWFRYGKPIERLCSGLPLYQLVKSQGPLTVQGCAHAGIPFIFGITICEKHH